jgi:hypothetical protein
MPSTVQRILSGLAPAPTVRQLDRNNAANLAASCSMVCHERARAAVVAKSFDRFVRGVQEAFLHGIEMESDGKLRAGS